MQRHFRNGVAGYDSACRCEAGTLPLGAREGGIEPDAWVKRFRNTASGALGKQPTFKQLEQLAKATHAPFGSFFLSEPLQEPVPIPDLRTVGNRFAGRPSVDLLDTLYLCQQRQDWYREFARMEGEDPLPFVGSATPASDVESTASKISGVLGFDPGERREMNTWTEALRRFIEQADGLGVLVMVNGVVGNNTRRKLDPDEFRGFALSDVEPVSVPSHEADAQTWVGVEGWCNRVAAELLVPEDLLRRAYRPSENLTAELDRLARDFKVSTLVVLRRIFDIAGLDRNILALAYRRELDRLQSLATAGGGNFYPTLKTRIGRRFGQALVTSTLGGRTSFSESFRLLGIKKTSTLRDFAASLDLR